MFPLPYCVPPEHFSPCLTKQAHFLSPSHWPIRHSILSVPTFQYSVQFLLLLMLSCCSAVFTLSQLSPSEQPGEAVMSKGQLTYSFTYLFSVPGMALRGAPHCQVMPLAYEFLELCLCSLPVQAASQCDIMGRFTSLASSMVSALLLYN